MHFPLGLAGHPLTSSESPFPPGSFALRVGDDLRRYLSNATLPKITLPEATRIMLPPSGHGSRHNKLGVRLEDQRLLTFIYQYQREQHASHIQHYTSNTIPGDMSALNIENEDEKTGEQFTIPCRNFDIPRPRISGLYSIEGFAQLVRNLPLETIQRTVHLVFPETHAFRIHAEQCDRDHEVMRIFTWRRLFSSTEPKLPDYTSMVILVQPPWILADKDFERVVNAEEFRSSERAWTHKITTREKVWAKIYDACIMRQCPWFILTNYNEWAFGVFTPGYTRAYISERIPFSADGPTVLEHLLFWFASAMGNPSGYECSQVPEPIYSDVPSRSSTPTIGARFQPSSPTVISSRASTVSYLADQDSDIGTVTSATFTDHTHVTFAVSDTNVRAKWQKPPVNRPPGNPEYKAALQTNLGEWIDKVYDVDPWSGQVVDDVVSVASTDWSNTTAPQTYEGVWLGPVRE